MANQHQARQFFFFNQLKAYLGEFDGKQTLIPYISCVDFRLIGPILGIQVQQYWTGQLAAVTHKCREVTS